MTASSLSPESQLLLLAISGHGDDRKIQCALQQDLDWLKIQALTRHEKAALLLWRGLEKIGNKGVPEEHAAALEKLAQIWRFKLLHLESLLHRTLDVYSKRGIEVLLLKGSGLAYTAYSSFEERPMYDLDILVQPEQAKEAWILAREDGWVWDSARSPLPQFDDHHHLPPLDDPQRTGGSLEIHTDLCRPGHQFRFSAREMWQDAREISVGGHKVRVPSLHHQILHTCIHFAWGHAMRRKSILTLNDVETFVNCGEVDWSELVDQARETRADTCCYWTFRLARKTAGIQVPEEVLEALRPNVPEFALNRFERHFALHMFPSEVRCPSVLAGKSIWQLAIRRGECEEMELLGVGRKPKKSPPGSFQDLLQRSSNQLQSLRGWGRYLRVALAGQVAPPLRG
ncbi:nucleotidyltransferase family protein [Myxococcota bacterium]|nr:nucleotidyltransferase family protein [Myxococcota bacterium]